MKLLGSKRLEKRLSRIEPNVKKAVSRANEAIGEDLAAESAKVCPVDTQTLLNSLYNETSDDGMSVEVGYGGSASEYMNYVHEWLDPSVNWTKPGTGAKYLSVPFLRNRDRYASAIMKAAGRAAMKGR